MRVRGVARVTSEISFVLYFVKYETKPVLLFCETNSQFREILL
jgi:hypothetical protein